MMIRIGGMEVPSVSSEYPRGTIGAGLLTPSFLHFLRRFPLPDLPYWASHHSFGSRNLRNHASSRGLSILSNGIIPMLPSNRATSGHSTIMSVFAMMLGSSSRMRTMPSINTIWSGFRNGAYRA